MQRVTVARQEKDNAEHQVKALPGKHMVDIGPPIVEDQAELNKQPQTTDDA